jgi:ureidoglycolate hydrolase
MDERLAQLGKLNKAWIDKATILAIIDTAEENQLRHVSSLESHPLEGYCYLCRF